MLGNTFREYLARKRPFYRPSPSENTFERYLAMILDCLCVQECPLLPMPHLVSCLGTHVKSLHSASCLEPSQTRKRPRIEHSASRHKTASHFLDTGNGTLFATTQGTYLLQTPCVLGCFVGLSTPGGLQYAGSGRALGCLPDNVGDARWLRACRSTCRCRRCRLAGWRLAPGVSGCLRGHRQGATAAQLAPGVPACSRGAATVWPAPGVPD